MSAALASPRALSDRVKPLLRGVSHQLAFYLALVTGGALTALATPGVPTWCALVYSICLVALFGISAAYHRPTLTPEARQWMRRLDHAGILLMIAGNYTPICLLAIKGPAGQRALIAVWIGAALGIVKSIVWVNAPKWLFALICVLFAWGMMAEWPALHAGIGDGGAWLLFAGGAMYTRGAVIYALKRPDPFPATFGYHEIFHALVIAAAVCHFFIVRALVLPA